MPDLTTIANLLGADDGKLIVAGVIFLILWVAKSSTWVSAKLLTTALRKRVFAGLLACVPAVALLTSGASVRQVVAYAILLFLAATGANTLRSSKANPKANIAPPEPEARPEIEVTADPKPEAKPVDDPKKVDEPEAKTPSP